MRTVFLCVIAFVWLSSAHAATPTTAVLNVANMTCAACGLTIKTALQREPGVTSTEINDTAGTVTVGFDADRTTVERVATVITEAGFPAKPRATHDG